MSYFYDLYGTEGFFACRGSQILQETIKILEDKDIGFLALVICKTLTVQNKRHTGDVCA